MTLVGMEYADDWEWSMTMIRMEYSDSGNGV